MKTEQTLESEVSEDLKEKETNNKKEETEENESIETVISSDPKKDEVHLRTYKRAQVVLSCKGQTTDCGTVKRLNKFVSVRTKVTASTVNVTIMREADGAILTYCLPIQFDYEEDE